MLGAPESPADNARFSAVAALTALGGHAAILALALWVRPTTEVVPLHDSVRVTLVGGSPAAAPAANHDQAHPRSSAPRPASAAPEDPSPSGARLDALLASSSPAWAAPSPAPSAPTTASGSVARGGQAAGSSRADTGLGPGEAADGIDLYAAASLPMVGQRPSPAPTGDLWRRVTPCWRPASLRPATLVIEIGANGLILGEPKAVRTRGAAADPPTLSAERAALRALQACAPYEGLEARRWRVTFQAAKIGGG